MERPAHKRPLLEESPLPLSDSNNVSDHLAKRIRLTLPPISSSFPPTNASTSYSSYKPPFPSSIHESSNFSILPPLSTTNSTNLSISSPRPIFNHDLPPIDSLCSLPPLNNFIQQTAPSVNPMSVSAILSNEEDTFVRIDTNSNEIASGNNNIGNRHHTPLDYRTPLNTSPVIKASSSPSLPTPLKLVQPIIEGMSEIENMHRMRRMERENNIVENSSNENGEGDGIEVEIEGENEGGYENEEEERYEMDEVDEEATQDYVAHEYDYHDEPQVIVENDETLNMEGREERHLGHLIYNSKEILPPLEFHENGLLEIWIESKYLTWLNEKVRTNALWGTDVYTDDSDVVAVLIHTGHYTPPPSLSEWTPDYPDHDLCVTIRVLPKLVQYTSTVRDGYKSRSWGNHHGVSYKIERVCKMKKGEAIGRSRGKGKKERLRKFHEMKKRAFGEIFGSSYDTSVLVFNNEEDPCYKYNQHMMMDEEELRKQLETNVLYLENDEERYEISYDAERKKYRFAIVASNTYLGTRTIFKDQVATTFPLEKSHLDEIFRDDLELREMTWNVVGVIVADKTNPQHSLLCISKRVYWRRKTECIEEKVA
ncbi:1338_t:CDS:2 [Funneliformis caledonium]|uniref:1338_t:CDS:1 n=1 Tax=Funneliformis caledonium TaxID=1117310 RepID=A0A9N9DL67_9GLOM|nr:1338_t:CDS:2 [Funneliformis caledonium]